MNRIGIIDWLGTVMPAAYSVNGTKLPLVYGGTPNFELKEIALRLFKQLLIMQKQRGWKAGIIAMDDRGHYWRKAVVDEWYATRGRYAKVVAEDGSEKHFMYFDNSVYELFDGERASRALPGKSVPDGIEWLPVPEELRHNLPRYKGHRAKRDWLLATEPEKFYAAVDNWRQWAAGLLGFKTLRVDGAEADDICAVAAGLVPDGWVADVVTIDSDYNQLVSDKITVLNLGGKIVKPESACENLKKLGAKIISGDSSDNISGFPKGAKGTYGAEGAKKLMDAFEGSTKDELISYLKAMGDTEILARNLRLILLPSPGEVEINKKIEQAIIEARPVEKEKDWSFFGITENMMAEIEQKALEAEFSSLFSDI